MRSLLRLDQMAEVSPEVSAEDEEIKLSVS